jgi:error-prone DNA polymerase
LPDGAWVKIAGLVLVRQRPGTAKGVIFATLEDESGVANVIVWADTFARYRQVVLKASLLAVEGRLQRENAVIHLVAQRLTDLSARLNALAAPLQGVTEPPQGSAEPLRGAADPEAPPAPPLEPPRAWADEVKRPGRALRGLPAGPDPLYPSRNFH